MTDIESGMDNKVLKDVLGRQVVQTVARARRPHDAPRQRWQKTVPPEKCFFCPGNESLTPPEIDRTEREGKWEVRVFPNKFPAFAPDSKKAYGRHEIIVETPDHQKTLSELPLENITGYLLMVKKRMLASQQDARLKYACVFKNEGREAGASLEHSHTQLVGMEFAPKFVQRMAKKASAFSRLQKSQARNVFFENERFFALCPKGSRFQHEIWVLPKWEVSSLSEMDDAQLGLLASALKSVMSALDTATGFGPYNIAFHSAPHGVKGFPFHLQILPRLANWAGFEFATEIVMSSAVPSDSAKLLRGLVPK